MGGSFLAKYLAEEQFPKSISETLIVASPFDSDGQDPIHEFILPSSFERLTKQAGKIFLYYSKDDPVVAFSELAKYQKALPHATARVFDDRKHFNQESFPELVADIKSI